MSKRKLELSSHTKRKRVALKFKIEWLDIKVCTSVPSSREVKYVMLSDIFQFIKELNVVKCKICTTAKVLGEFSTGKRWDEWKLDYLKRHLLQKTHLDAVESIRLREKEKIKYLLQETPDDRNSRHQLEIRKKSSKEDVKILIDNVILAIKINASMNSIENINKHMSKYIPSIPENWRGKNYAFEFVECISSMIQNIHLNEIRVANYHCLIIDESTDISITKLLVIYIKYCYEGVFKTVFVAIRKLTECDANSIVNIIKNLYVEFNLDLRKMVMITSDGAAVMLGTKNGVAAILRREVKHLTVQHCVAHREDLGIDDAWSKNSLMKDINTLVKTIYANFHRSSQKIHKFEEFASVLNCNILSFRPINEVRWLSRQLAIIPIIRNYKVLIKYYAKDVEDNNDPIAKYCLRSLENNTIFFAIIVLNDILHELGILCKYLQKSNLSPMEANEFVKSIIHKIKHQYLGSKPYWSTDAEQVLSKTENNQSRVDPNLVLKFIKDVCDHLTKRFPPDDMTNWSLDKS